MKKLNKKGFTLAELLIVVAIIAVLTAIAVPLFVGALDKAEKATFEANQRSIQGMGVAILLTDENANLENAAADAKWFAYAVVTDGKIGEVTVSTKDPSVAATEPAAVPATGTKDYTEWKGNKSLAIVAEITRTTLNEYKG